MNEKFRPKISDEVSFSFRQGDPVYTGVVMSIDGELIVLRHNNALVSEADYKDSAIIYDNNMDYYVDIVAVGKDNLTIKGSRVGEREFFRIEDVIPMVITKVDKSNTARRSRILTGYHSDMPTVIREETQGSVDENLHPLLLKKLGEIDAKVSLILERLYLESEGLFKADNYRVNISGSGISFIDHNRYDAGEVVELKMLLSTYPTVAVHTYGQILNVGEHEQDFYKMGARFIDIDEDIRTEIIQFTMRREREKRMVV